MLITNCQKRVCGIYWVLNKCKDELLIPSQSSNKFSTLSLYSQFQINAFMLCGVKYLNWGNSTYSEKFTLAKKT
jgi:hypothetical protein